DLVITESGPLEQGHGPVGVPAVLEDADDGGTCLSCHEMLLMPLPEGWRRDRSDVVPPCLSAPGGFANRMPPFTWSPCMHVGQGVRLRFEWRTPLLLGGLAPRRTVSPSSEREALPLAEAVFQRKSGPEPG